MSKPTDDRLRGSEWFVADCDMAIARRLISLHHYAGGASNTAVDIHGLYRKADGHLSGVAWWLPPTKVAAASVWEEFRDVLSLSRLVILPGVPKNAASFLLARSTKRIGDRWRCLLTYADTWKGHTGHIYKVAGWEELGLTKPQPIYTIDDKVVSKKIGPKTRSHLQMLALGAVYEGSFPRWKFRLVRKQPKRPKLNLFRQEEMFTQDFEVSA